MSKEQKKEEIDEIMEEMEALTPAATDKTKTFAEFDDIDAKGGNFESSNFFSSIFAKTPKKPGELYPSRPNDERYYDFTHPNIGYAVIFNQINIYGESKRDGSEKDGEDLENVLKDIGFKVEHCRDFTINKIEEKLDELSKRDHSDNDCLLITIMTHGQEGGGICAKDGRFAVNDLWECFIGNNCPSLIGKPKLFFIQACRGTWTDPGILLKKKPVNMVYKDFTDSKSSDQEDVFVLPTLADLLVMYSTSEGFYSFRNNAKGSWFIQALCEELKENSCVDELMTLLTNVNRRVAYGKQAYTDNKEKNATKQMPLIKSMLTKSFYFRNRKQKEKVVLNTQPLELNLRIEKHFSVPSNTGAFPKQH